MEHKPENTSLDEKKPSVADTSDNISSKENAQHLNLKVEFPEGEFTNFKIKRVTKMEKLMKAFYAQKGLQPGSVRLLLDDRRIHPNDTAETLNAEDGDVINVYSEQAGGQVPGEDQFSFEHSDSVSAGLEQQMALLIELIEDAQQTIEDLRKEQQELMERRAEIEEDLEKMRGDVEREKMDIEALEMEIEAAVDIKNTFDANDVE